jgi:hypothetical protein
MKKLAIVLAVGILSACSSTKDTYTQRVVQDTERQEKAAERAIDKAPEWMSKLPKSTNAVYESATAVSADFAMADMMAKTIAYAKICVAAGGTVRQQTKMLGTDAGVTMEMAVRSMCKDVDITGVETVEMKHIPEYGRIRTYALVALPIGTANTLRKEADAREDRASMRRRAPEAFKELDEVTTGKKQPGLPHETVTDPKVKARVNAALDSGKAVILTETIR